VSVSVAPALLPRTTLLPPDVIAVPALFPTAVLLSPEVIASKA
jgi:hypothetical protein